MTEYPRITELLDNCARWPDWRKYNKDLETELRALLAERDALKAKAQPVRKLREYKGVTYDPMQGQYVNGGLWRFDGSDYETVALLIHQNDFDFTDADHAAIYALRDDPYKPVETVEDIVRDVVRCGTMDFIDSYATRLRAAVAAEGVRDA